MTTKRHRHEFSLLWYHFGPYGPQNVHIHPCFTDDCNRVFLGPDRDCDGDKDTHYRETLGSKPLDALAAAPGSTDAVR